MEVANVSYLSGILVSTILPFVVCCRAQKCIFLTILIGKVRVAVMPYCCLETLDTSTESETTYSPHTQLRDRLAGPASRHPMHVTGVSVHTSDKAARDTLKTASTL